MLEPHHLLNKMIFYYFILYINKYKMKIINELYILGENAQDNWNILELTKPNHYFFHLASFPSPYVILTCEDIPSPKDIITGAQI